MQKQGGTLLAIAADPLEKSRDVVAKARLPFPILDDSNLTAIRLFGVLHPDGRPTGGDIALPAQFLFDKDGKLVWRFVSRRAADRLSAAEVMEHVRSLSAR